MGGGPGSVGLRPRRVPRVRVWLQTELSCVLDLAPQPLHICVSLRDIRRALPVRQTPAFEAQRQALAVRMAVGRPPRLCQPACPASGSMRHQRRRPRGPDDRCGHAASVPSPTPRPTVPFDRSTAKKITRYRAVPLPPPAFRAVRVSRSPKSRHVHRLNTTAESCTHINVFRTRRPPCVRQIRYYRHIKAKEAPHVDPGQTL